MQTFLEQTVSSNYSFSPRGLEYFFFFFEDQKDEFTFNALNR